MPRTATPSKKTPRPAPRGAASKPRPAAGGGASIDRYEDALALLEGRINVERLAPKAIDPQAFKLDRMRALAQALGNPERLVKFVHVAGSKGKGSTTEMLAAALAGCGYAVGVYTSPHLVDLRERIRIGEHPISKEDFTAALAEVAAALPAVEKKHGAATFFELLTAAALVYFARQAVDVAVLEVGLGGRLDSTNIVTPEVCVVTAIQLEHTQILGDTLEKIAAEKAGILKNGVPAVTLAQSPGVLEVLREKAAAAGCELRVLGQEVEYTERFEAGSRSMGDDVLGAKVCLSTPRSSFEHLSVPLKGEHQAANCGLALAALDALRERGWEISERRVAAGLARTLSPGRMELIGRSPRVMIDGAHTADSVRALVKALGAHQRYDNLVVIFGCAPDKDVGGMLAALAMGADKVIFTRALGTSRACEPKDLQRRFMEGQSKAAQIAPDFTQALTLALRGAQRDDLILVTGSFYLAGEAKKLAMERRARAAQHAAGSAPARA